MTVDNKRVKKDKDKMKTKKMRDKNRWILGNNPSRKSNKKKIKIRIRDPKWLLVLK